MPITADESKALYNEVHDTSDCLNPRPLNLSETDETMLRQDAARFVWLVTCMFVERRSGEFLTDSASREIISKLNFAANHASEEYKRLCDRVAQMVGPVQITHDMLLGDIQILLREINQGEKPYSPLLFLPAVHAEFDSLCKCDGYDFSPAAEHFLYLSWPLVFDKREFYHGTQHTYPAPLTLTEESLEYMRNYSERVESP